MYPKKTELDGASEIIGRRPHTFLLSLVAGRTEAISIQALRYMAVGLFATAVDMAILYILTKNVGMPYMISAIFGFIMGLTVNYLISINWVFASRTLANRAAEFTAFGLIGIIGLGLTEIILYTGVRLLNIHYMLAKTMAVAIVFAWNFGARRVLLFRGKS
jgi:putative flippase GtrA